MQLDFFQSLVLLSKKSEKILPRNVVELMYQCLNFKRWGNDVCKIFYQNIGEKSAAKFGDVCLCCNYKWMICTSDSVFPWEYLNENFHIFMHISDLIENPIFFWRNITNLCIHVGPKHAKIRQSAAGNRLVDDNVGVVYNSKTRQYQIGETFILNSETPEYLLHNSGKTTRQI